MLGGQATQCARVFVTLLLTATLIYTIVLNGLAGPGAGPFTQSTRNVSDLLYTCITPAGFTFSIWSVIYISLVLVIIYANTLLFRKVDGEQAWKNGGAISIPFMLTLIVNLNLNCGWLFAWDAVNVTASAILLLLIAVTNGLAISLSAYSFAKAARTLYQSSKLDFWAGILSINGLGFYDMWTTLASLINLSAFFIYEVKQVKNNVCMGVLIFLLIAIIGWFIIENFLLIVFGNPLITHYLVVAWAMGGIYSSQKDQATDVVLGLVIAIMVTACILFVARIGFLLYRNRGNKLYDNIVTDVEKMEE